LNRLPVCEKKITLILDFLKEYKDNAYNRRQITEHLWANYSFCDYKTFDQLLREVGEKLYVHVNNQDTETVQIVQYNTKPYTYQFVGSLHNTKLENNQIVMVFDEEPKAIDIEETSTVEETSTIDENVEQSNLIEDLKAADKIQFNSLLASLGDLLQSSPDKTKMITEILAVIIHNA
jgi:hypothetical protein